MERPEGRSRQAAENPVNEFVKVHDTRSRDHSRVRANGLKQNVCIHNANKNAK